MAIKKSELYSSLWKSCDELRGGMDASQYKDYVLVLLFVKYVSDKYAGQPNALIEVPVGGSFADMLALKGDKEIGDKINKIIAKLAEANDLKGVIDVADFNDPDKLGKGKEMQDRLSNLVAIFANPALNFRKNRAEGDDILGDAYEYLMRHFATESGKSKGQFYTPSEVSRVIAKVVGINKARSQSQTIYDPTCGSGSLLLKAADESQTGVTIYGQEMDNATAALCQMRLLIVVDKLLTGFDAPSATYLYIDKQMRDHGLFQAICRVNRLDGEDKDYGYIVDYKDLFKSLQHSIQDYTSDALDGYDKEDVEGLLSKRIVRGKERLEEAREAIKALCELVDPPRDTTDYIRYFCAKDTADKDALKDNEPRRVALYKLAASLIRAYANLANELPEAGYTAPEIAQIKQEVDYYEKVRAEVKMASGDYIDLKMYEPAMRHLIDTYIRAEESKKISAFEDISLIQLIVERGESGRVGRETDEDQMGHLQHQSSPHLAQSRTNQETCSLLRVHHRPRNDPPARTPPQRAFYWLYEQLHATLAILSRGAESGAVGA
jgi:hypothetical protein